MSCPKLDDDTKCFMVFGAICCTGVSTLTTLIAGYHYYKIYTCKDMSVLAPMCGYQYQITADALSADNMRDRK